jgi:hypothetical protein
MTLPLLVEHGRNKVGEGLGIHLSVFAQLVQVVAELEAIEPSQLCAKAM